MPNFIHIKTKSGLEVDIDPAVTDDMEVLDACYAVQENEDIMALSKLMSLLLNPQDKKRLYDHVRKPDGRVPYQPLMDEIADIFAGVGQHNAAVQAGKTPAPTPVPDPEPAPATEPEPLFPGPGPLPPFDKTQPPPAWHVDNVMSRLHGALHKSPATAKKLERAARTALDVAKPALAWELLDKLEREMDAADAVKAAQEAAEKHPGPMTEALLHDVTDALRADMTPRPSDPVPTGAQAVTADFIRAGTYAPDCNPADSTDKAAPATE